MTDTDGPWQVLRSAALAFPEAWEDFPWGEPVVKVAQKVFVFLGAHDVEATCGVKLTDSLDHARSLAAVTPTGYGLGKHGWVSIRLDGTIPVDVLLDWVDESYRAVALKRLVRRLDAEAGPG